MSALSITAQESGITSVPIAILEALFDKAATLLSTPGSVVPKPGASDGSFMVAGVSNKVHSVTPGKGGSLSCDNNCVNRSTKICEHTLAVAQLNGTLQEFVTWYKRSKRGPNLTSMAAAGGPKNAGRKPSKRKRSNAKTQPVLQQIDLLQHNPDELHPDGLGNSEAIGGQFNIAASSVPVQSSSQYSAPSGPLQRSSQYNIPNVVLQSSSHYNVPSVPVQSSSQYSALSGPLQRSSQYNLPSVVLQSSSQYSAPSVPLQSSSQYNVPSVALQRSSQYSVSHTSAAQVQGTPNHIVAQQIGTPTHPYAPQHGLHGIPQAPHATNARSFTLKWLMGTRVSRCYGCGEMIQNPPLNCPDELIVMCRDFRLFRHRITGQLTTSPVPQNVHFHLRLACVRARYPDFVPSSIHVPPHFVARFQVEHLGRLLLEFGWTPGH